MEQKHEQAKEGAKYASEKYEKWAVRSPTTSLAYLTSFYIAILCSDERTSADRRPPPP